MTRPSPIVKVRGLHKYFGSNHIIKGIDLDVQAGEILAIIGPSGAGKSTFLRCINFLEPFSAGTVAVGGITIAARDSDDPWNADMRAIRRRAAMVFQNFNLFPHMTVLENLIQGAISVSKLPRSQAVSRAEALLNDSGLLARRDAMPGQLSAGEQQQVAIARSLCMEPQVILFDDPTSALDPLLIRDLAGTLTRLADSGIASLVATNAPAIARHTAQRVLFMEAGQWVEIGAPARIFEGPTSARTRAFVDRIALKETTLRL